MNMSIYTALNLIDLVIIIIIINKKIKANENMYLVCVILNILDTRVIYIEFIHD